jgi:hypothetical protein
LRQRVRELAHSAGLRSSGQAKLTAAITSVARVTLLHDSGVHFTFQKMVAERRAWIEITCATAWFRSDTAAAAPGELPDLREACLLVDEIVSAAESEHLLLTIRMSIQHA